MRILTSAQMREADRLTVEECGISMATLMETAGVRVVEEMAGEGMKIGGGRFLVFCGRGNNGGDGAVVARHLAIRGAQLVGVMLLGQVERMVGEARENMEIVRRLAGGAGDGQIVFEEVEEEGAIDRLTGQLMAAGVKGLVVVDAIFGTGLSRAVSGVAARAIAGIEVLRGGGAKVVAVDLPSGLASDSGLLIGPCVGADLTVTMTRPKVANILLPAAERNGRLKVVGIGTPRRMIDRLTAVSGGRLELVEEERVARWLEGTRRGRMAHKGVVGNLLLVAGSRGRTGAAALAAKAALRAGAGTMTVATPRSALDLLVAQLMPEIMTEWLAETPGGGIAGESLRAALDLAKGRAAIGIGPGLSSREEASRNFVRNFVEGADSPMVIDADGLNALAPWPPDLRGRDEKPIIITPHPGEMARLTGLTTAEVEADRVGVARGLALRQGLTVVLKGARTLIATPDGAVFVVPFGNPGMATAGSGDVLTGILVSLLGQAAGGDMPITETVIAGVSLHAIAGDLAAQRFGQRSLVASSIIGELPQAMIDIGGEAERGIEPRRHSEMEECGQ